MTVFSSCIALVASITVANMLMHAPCYGPLVCIGGLTRTSWMSSPAQFYMRAMLGMSSRSARPHSSPTRRETFTRTHPLLAPTHHLLRCRMYSGNDRSFPDDDAADDDAADGRSAGDDGSTGYVCAVTRWYSSRNVWNATSNAIGASCTHFSFDGYWFAICLICAEFAICSIHAECASAWSAFFPAHDTVTNGQFPGGHCWYRFEYFHCSDPVHDSRCVSFPPVTAK